MFWCNFPGLTESIPLYWHIDSLYSNESFILIDVVRDLSHVLHHGIGHATLVTITGTTLRVPYLWFKPLQLIWRLRLLLMKFLIYGCMIFKWFAEIWLYDRYQDSNPIDACRQHVPLSEQPGTYYSSIFTRGQYWPPGIVVACVCPSVSPSVIKFVRAITRHPFKLGSPNLDHRCKRPWLRSLIFWGVTDLDL